MIQQNMKIQQKSLMICNRQANRAEIKEQILNYAIDLKKIITNDDSKIDAELNNIIKEIQIKINDNGLLLKDIIFYNNRIKESVGNIFYKVHQENINTLLKCVILLAEHKNSIFGRGNTTSINSLIKLKKPINEQSITNAELAKLTDELSHIFPPKTTVIYEQPNPAESADYTNSTQNNINDIIRYRAREISRYPLDKNAASIPIHNNFTINPQYAYIMFIDRKNLYCDPLNRTYGPKMFDDKKDDCSSHESYVIDSYQAFNQLLDVKKISFDDLMMANKTALGDKLHKLTVNCNARNPSANYMFMEDLSGETLTRKERYQRQRQNDYHNYYDKQYLLNPKCKDESYNYDLTLFTNRIGITVIDNKLCPNENDMLIITQNIAKNPDLKEKYSLTDTDYISGQTLNEEQISTINRLFEDKDFRKEVTVDDRFIPRHYIKSNYENQNEIETYFNQYLTLFNKNITESGSDDKQKIAAILLFISQIECSHFFTNGNNRVCCQMLLNKLLIDHNLLPSILYIPNGISHYVLSLIHMQMEKNKNVKNIPEVKELSKCLALPIALVLEGQEFFSQIVVPKKPN